MSQQCKCISLVVHTPGWNMDNRWVASAHVSGDPVLMVEYPEQPFSYARAMNRAIEQALKMPDWDYAIIMDADGLFVGMSNPPANGFGCCAVYRPLQFESPDEYLTHEDQWSAGSSYFVIRRDLLMQNWCRFCNEMEVYGYEDFDFNHNVMLPKLKQFTECNAKAIHLWHPCRSGIHPPNRRLYADRYKDIYGKYPDPSYAT